MHEEFMKDYGGYLKEHYNNLETMSVKDLCDARCIAEVMEQIFKADIAYNTVKAMEEHNDNADIEMTWNEFYVRLKDMYENADAATKAVMKQQVNILMT